MVKFLQLEEIIFLKTVKKDTDSAVERTCILTSYNTYTNNIIYN
jgi:hypothetical protein